MGRRWNTDEKLLAGPKRATEDSVPVTGPFRPRQAGRGRPKGVNNSVAGGSGGHFDASMTFEKSLADTVRTLESLRRIRPAIERASKLILSTLEANGRLLICGNGGSAAEAAHFATELVGRYHRRRRSLPALALSSDGSLVSCIGNDFGFEQVFARQIGGLARKGDLVVVISSSGNSPNILAALKEAKRLRIKTLALLGREGGKAKGMATCELLVPGSRGASAQESHLFIIHYFCEQIDTLFK